MVAHNTEIRGLWSHARIYALGSLINRAAGIVLIPVYTHLLPAAEYGLYTIVVITADMAAVLISGVVGTAMVRVYLESDDPNHRAVVASTAFVSFVLLGLTAALLAHPLSALVSKLVLHSSHHSRLFELAIYSSLLSLLFNLELDYFRAEKRPWIYLILSSAKSVTLFLLSIVLVVHFQLGVMGIVLATVATFLVIGVGTLYRVLRHTGVHFDRRHVRAMLVIGLPMLPSRLADLSTEFTDKYFINRFVGAGAVGNYSLAQRLGSLLQNFVAGPFAQIWIVRRLETLGAATGQELFARIFTLFLAAMLGAGLLLATYAPELVAVISSAQYQGATELVPLIALSMAIMPIDMNFQLSIIHAKKTIFLMYASFAAAAVNIVLMYVLVRDHAALGAAAALLLTNLTRVALVAWFSLRYCDTTLRFEWARTVALLGFAIICFVAERLTFGIAVDIAQIFEKLPLLLIYAAPAWYLLRTPVHGRARV